MRMRDCTSFSLTPHEGACYGKVLTGMPQQYPQPTPLSMTVANYHYSRKTVRMRQAPAVQACCSSVPNVVPVCLNEDIKLGPSEDNALSNHHVTIYCVVPVGHVLVLPHNGADSLGLQPQELRLFSAASG